MKSCRRKAMRSNTSATMAGQIRAWRSGMMQGMRFMIVSHDIREHMCVIMEMGVTREVSFLSVLASSEVISD